MIIDPAEMGPAEEIQRADADADADDFGLTDRQFFTIAALLLSCTVLACLVSLFLIWKG